MNKEQTKKEIMELVRNLPDAWSTVTEERIIGKIKERLDKL